MKRKLLFLLICLPFHMPHALAQSEAKTTRIVRWAHVYEQSHPLHKWALWASKEIYSQTNGRYKIKVFPSSSLGKEAQINQSISIGSIDIIYTGVSFAAQAHPPLGLSEMPYIFEDYSHWQRFVASELFTQLSKEYHEKSHGNHIMGSSYYGERHLTANRPVLSPEDIEGLKIRVPGAAIYQIFPLALGAKPSPIAFSEVYLAIQQGVVDSQENPLVTIQAKRFYEVQEHINLTGHILGSILTVMSDDLLTALSSDDKNTFSEVLKQAAQQASQETREYEAKLLQWFEEQNISVNSVDRAAFRNNVLRYTQNIIPLESRATYDHIQTL